MSYVVTIRDNADSETVEYEVNFPWSDYTMFMWKDGNWGCDCNREGMFAFAKGIEPSCDPECGDGVRYSVLRAVLEDGTVIEIEA